MEVIPLGERIAQKEFPITLGELIRAVIDTDKPDRVVDVAIFRWLNPTLAIEYIDDYDGEISFYGKTSSVWAPRYTGSVDAAMKLIEDDDSYVKIERDGPSNFWSVWVHPFDQGYGKETQPLAICLAALKAIELKEINNEILSGS